MNKLIWTFQILVTLVFVFLGGQKVVLPIPDLIAFGMLWIEDFSTFQVRAIGALETLGALGMNAPFLIKALPKILSPLAAAGLGVTMTGAVTTHVMRGDPAASIIITTALVGMCMTIAKGRMTQMKSVEATT